VNGIECFWEYTRFLDFITHTPRQISLIIFGDGEELNADISLVEEVVRACEETPVLMWSQDGSCRRVVQAMKAGVAHFLQEPFTGAELLDVVRRIGMDESELSTVATAPTYPPVRTGWEQRVSPLLEKLRRADTPLLIQGETGVGKENLARRIHDASPRCGKTFLKMNCAALPSELVESELFGYERGAFTGAFRSNRGKFEAANGGTILLDEIGDMDLKVQAKLLQVLQDQEFIPLGARHLVKVDVRVIAATHRNLERQVEEGKFREDLYYRLNVINIVIPPLRDRIDEIAGLAAHFLEKHAGGELPPPITNDILEALYNYAWPGNIRELENLMRRYFVLRDPVSILEDLRNKASAGKLMAPASRGYALDPVPATKTESAKPPVCEKLAPEPVAFMPGPVLDGRPRVAAESLSEIDGQRRQAEAEVILRTLNATLWNRKEAAAQLNIEYKALLYKMKKLNIGSKPPAQTSMRAAAGD
jgi:two-component system response regulator AtoC